MSVYPRVTPWEDWFAWHWVTTDCGKRAWLTTVERRWNTHRFQVTDLFGYGHYRGGFEYRLSDDPWTSEWLAVS